jgi:hypothetical protein
VVYAPQRAIQACIQKPENIIVHASTPFNGFQRTLPRRRYVQRSSSDSLRLLPGEGGARDAGPTPSSGSARRFFGTTTVRAMGGPKCATS